MRELQSLPKGSAIWSKKASTSARTVFNHCAQNLGIMKASTMAAIVRGQEQ